MVAAHDFSPQLRLEQSNSEDGLGISRLLSIIQKSDVPECSAHRDESNYKKFHEIRFDDHMKNGIKEEQPAQRLNTVQMLLYRQLNQFNCTTATVQAT